MIMPPYMLEYQCGLTAGQFPKFADEVYKIANPTDEAEFITCCLQQKLRWHLFTEMRS